MYILSLTTLFNVANAGFFGSGMGLPDIGGWGMSGNAHVQPLLDYAKSQTDWSWGTIESNVQAQLQNNPTIDLLWPGNGYDQSAYAGQYAVLKYLESHGVLKVGRIMGGSGGATAALLALGTDETGVDAARSMTESFGVQADMFGFTSELEEEYRTRTSTWTGGLKGSITSDLFVAVLAGNYHKYVVHNLQNPNQAAMAVSGSGATGWTIDIPGLSCLGATFDGGVMSAFHNHHRPTIYTAAWYGNAAGCDRSCITTNFKKGVDQTIALLTSSNLVASDVTSWNGCGFFDCSGMILSKTGTGADLENLAYQHLNGGHPLRYEPVKSSENTWVDAASYCPLENMFGRRRSVDSLARLSLLESVEEPEEQTAGF